MLELSHRWYYRCPKDAEGSDPHAASIPMGEADAALIRKSSLPNLHFPCRKCGIAHEGFLDRLEVEHAKQTPDTSNR
jgi:hypothetical protein